MTCFWIGINHVSHGFTKIKPGKRLTLELLSLVLVLITWCFTIPGIVLLANAGIYNTMMDGKLDFGQLMNIFTSLMGGESSTTQDEVDLDGGISIFKALGNDIFVANNTIYTIVTAILLILNLFFRKEYLKMGQKPLPRNSEWAQRKSRDNCCGICSPCNALRMFHHLEHRAAFIVNLLCAILGVDLYFSIPLVLLTFTQTIISYLYAEDIVLCGLPICCVHFLFIRRYPQEELGDMDHKMEGVLSV